MDPTNWIQDKFGTDDPKTLLDEEVYSQKDLRKDKKKLNMKLTQTAKEQEKHEKKYQELLQKGADADRESSQKQFATKAKFEKKKYKAKKKKHKTHSVKLGTVIAVEGMRDVLEIQQEDQLELGGAIEDADTQELQSQIMDQMAEFGLEMEDMKQVQEALDIEVLDDDLENDVSEEMQMMQQMEADEISDEAIDLESQVESEDDDIDMDGDYDIDDDDEPDMEASI